VVHQFFATLILWSTMKGGNGAMLHVKRIYFEVKKEKKNK